MSGTNNSARKVIRESSVAFISDELFRPTSGPGHATASTSAVDEAEPVDQPARPRIPGHQRLGNVASPQRGGNVFQQSTGASLSRAQLQQNAMAAASSVAVGALHSPLSSPVASSPFSSPNRARNRVDDDEHKSAIKPSSSSLTRPVLSVSSLNATGVGHSVPISSPAQTKSSIPVSSSTSTATANTHTPMEMDIIDADAALAAKLQNEWNEQDDALGESPPDAPAPVAAHTSHKRGRDTLFQNEDDISTDDKGDDDDYEDEEETKKKRVRTKPPLTRDTKRHKSGAATTAAASSSSTPASVGEFRSKKATAAARKRGGGSSTTPIELDNEDEPMPDSNHSVRVEAKLKSTAPFPSSSLSSLPAPSNISLALSTQIDQAKFDSLLYSGNAKLMFDQIATDAKVHPDLLHQAYQEKSHQQAVASSAAKSTRAQPTATSVASLSSSISSPLVAPLALSSSNSSSIEAHEKAVIASMQHEQKRITDLQRAEFKEAQKKLIPSHSAKDITLFEMANYYKLTSDPCTKPPGVKTCPNSPNCLHGCVMVTTKRGIWAPKPPQLKALGIDPASRQRGGAISHAGLKNLGATCYMNTLFQCLFMNAHFRNAIYRFRPKPHSPAIHATTPMDLDEDARKRPATPDPLTLSMDIEDDHKDATSVTLPDSEETKHAEQKRAREVAGDRIVCELQNLFARLEFGHASFEDPTRIVESLGLKPGEQQDINEFNNLFLSMVEERLKSSGLPGVSTLIDDEFKGTINHTIKCLNCKTESRNRTSYYDLTVQISKLKTVRECLITHMQKEDLKEKNQYRCSNCKSHQDAERSTVLETLPPVLNLQLLRFAYDAASGTKKKLSDNISIPATLDMSPFLDEKQIDQLGHELVMQQAAAAGVDVASAIPIDSDLPSGAPSTSASPVASPRTKKEKPPSPAASGRKLRPASPSMASASSASPASSHLYELTAILRHKGTSAHHGHYIADIRDPSDSSRWWRFDDASCKPLTHFDDGAGVVIDADKKKGKKGGKKKKKDEDAESDFDEDDFKEEAAKPKKKKDEDEEEAEESEEEEKSDEIEIVEKAPPKLNLDNISSRNAYMLVYTLVGRPKPKSIKRSQLTPEMEEQIQESDTKLEQEIKEYAAKRSKLESLIQARKAKCEAFEALGGAVEIQEWNKANVGRREHISNQDRIDLMSDPGAVFDKWLIEDLSDCFMVYGPWLRRWFLGETEPTESLNLTSGGVINLADDDTTGPNGEVSPAMLKQIAESEAAEKAAKEFDRTGQLPEAVEEKKDRMEDVLDAAAATVGTNSSSSAAAASSIVSPSPRPPLILRHPLYPGDLIDSLKLLLCEHGQPQPQHPMMKLISGEQFNIILEDNNRQKEFLWKEQYPSLPLPNKAEAAKYAYEKFVATNLCKPCCQQLYAHDQQLKEDRLKRDRLYHALTEFRHGNYETKRLEDGTAEVVINHTDERFRYADPKEHNKQFGLNHDSARIISKDAMIKWLKKAKTDSDARKFTQVPDLELNINKSLICKHGALDPDVDLRYLLPLSLWKQFLHFYPSSTTFMRRDPVCPTCQRLSTSNDAKNAEIRQRLETDQLLFKTKPVIEFPVNGKILPITPVDSFRILLPGDWAQAFLIHWKGDADRLLPDLNTRKLLCHHDKLLYNPVPDGHVPLLKGDAPYCDLPGTPPGLLAFCDLAFWNGLMRSAYVKDEADVPQLKLQIKPRGALGVTDNHMWDFYRVTTTPEPCAECVLKRVAESRAEANAWAYSVLEINVLAPHAILPSAVAPPPSAMAAGRPKRAATKKAKVGCELTHKFTTEVMQSSDPLSKVKLNIYQESDIPPGQQQIYCNGKLLDGDANTTLAELQIPPNSELWVVVDPNGDTDVSSFFGESSVRARGPESGFAGTALSSAPRPRASSAAAASSSSSTSPPVVAASKWSCNVCTFENEAGHLQCSICATAKAS